VASECAFSHHQIITDGHVYIAKYIASSVPHIQQVIMARSCWPRPHPCSVLFALSAVVLLSSSAGQGVWAPTTQEDVQRVLDVVGRGAADAETHTFVLFTSSSPRCSMCLAASTSFEQVAAEFEHRPARLLFVEVDEQVAATQPLFTAANVTLGPSVLYLSPVPRRSGARAQKVWFHDVMAASHEHSNRGSGVDYLRLSEFVAASTGTLDDNPASWIQPMDAEYSSNPTRWLQRVTLLSHRLRGYHPPFRIPAAIGWRTNAFITDVHRHQITVSSPGSSMPFRPNPDHTAGDPLADFLHDLAQQKDVGLVLESGTGPFFFPWI